VGIPFKTNVLYINIDLAGSGTSFQYARFINSENKRSVRWLRATVCVKSNDIYPRYHPQPSVRKKGLKSTHYLTLYSVANLWLMCPSAVNIYPSTESVEFSTRNCWGILPYFFSAWPTLHIAAPDRHPETINHPDCSTHCRYAALYALTQISSLLHRAFPELRLFEIWQG